MALAKFLRPRPNMELFSSEQISDEGHKQGLRVFPGDTPGSNILLNATCNNYTITNHYRSKTQVEATINLERENAKLRKKYKSAKKMLLHLGPLVKHIPTNRLDEQTRRSVTEFNTKWTQMTNKKRSAATYSDDETLSTSSSSIETDSHKKQRL